MALTLLLNLGPSKHRYDIAAKLPKAQYHRHE